MLCLTVFCSPALGTLLEKLYSWILPRAGKWKVTMHLLHIPFLHQLPRGWFVLKENRACHFGSFFILPHGSIQKMQQDATLASSSHKKDVRHHASGVVDSMVGALIILCSHASAMEIVNVYYSTSTIRFPYTSTIHTQNTDEQPDFISIKCLRRGKSSENEQRLSKSRMKISKLAFIFKNWNFKQLKSEHSFNRLNG